jgi:hypothetical protein
MKQLSTKLSVDWGAVANELDEKGFASVSRVLPANICEEFVKDYDRPGLYRKTVVMERHRFGLGEYKYFDYPLAEFIQAVRETIYPKLAPIANDWMNKLDIDTRFPQEFSELQKLCRKHGQTRPTP